jgi:hypothetical protein
MTNKKLSFLLVTFLLFIGCSTGYQPSGFKGGYTDRQVTKETYFVSFRGNGYTNKGDVLIFFLLRCAEVTKMNGYDYFQIQNSNLSDNVSSVYVPGQTSSNTIGNTYTVKSSGQQYGNYQTTATTSPGYNINIKKPYMEGIIKVFVGEKPDQPNMYSVQEIITLHGHHLD